MVVVLLAAFPLGAAIAKQVGSPRDPTVVASADPPAAPSSTATGPATGPAAPTTATAPTTTTTAPGPPKVAAVGDSLVEFQEDVAPTLTQAITARGWEPAVHGVGGSSTFEIRGFYSNEIADADAVLFVAGANDVVWVEDQPDLPAAVAALRSQFEAAMVDMADVDCVVWPTVIETPNFYWAGPDPGARAVNDLIRSVAAVNPNVVVVDWAAASAGHPEWFIPDLLHHSPQGEAEFRRLLLDAAAGCLAP